MLHCTKCSLRQTLSVNQTNCHRSGHDGIIGEVRFLAQQRKILVLVIVVVKFIDVIDFVFQAVPHDPVPLGAIRKGIARALEQVDGFIFGQVQAHRKGQHRFLFGVVLAVALNFGEMLPGDVGLLVHGGVFQPPLVNEPQRSMAAKSSPPQDRGWSCCLLSCVFSLRPSIQA